MSYKIATVWGIPIKLHISLLILLVLMVQDFHLMNGILVAVGLLVSIILHELGHSIVAIRKGCRVREITLMFMGGAAVMDRMPTKPLDEFLMAVAGPLVSLILGCAGIYGGAKLDIPPLLAYPPANILQFFGYMNISLMVFNLLPSFPMDGGRVFRAMLTPKLGRLRATRVAARTGQFMAVLFGVVGVWGIPGILPAHSWMLVVIAFFVFTSAGNEYRMVQMQEAARQHGFTAWPPFFEEPPGGESQVDDQVVISPPPYQSGPGTKTDIHSSDESNPFKDMFGH
jgi:Zn-dependent protease